ncbi:SRPBCC family protein [Streptomyces tropicalis]|uniref:SRPBCC family protein n=1 Tax=Streptomyces tropicalis TaxID=3034234 RepID=A0ABT6ABN9_9ACTN|nr:SRPBCC family protein [Streptomyces tropicalis]MDF3302051.1 SRPBCC family protein [Streptomyces tropicalis]
MQCDVHIEAAVPRVWDLVTDIGLPARLSPELQRTAWLDGADGPRVGARFEGHNRNTLVGEWRTVSHVIEVDDQRAFAWAVTAPEGGLYGDASTDPAKPLATWRYDLAPEDGGTRLRQTALLGPGPSGLTRAIASHPDREEEIVAFRVEDLRTGMEATLAGIKTLAEGGDR